MRQNNAFWNFNHKERKNIGQKIPISEKIIATILVRGLQLFEKCNK